MAPSWLLVIGAILSHSAHLSIAFPFKSVSFWINIHGCRNLTTAPTSNEMSEFQRYWSTDVDLGAPRFFRECSYDSPDFRFDALDHTIFPKVVDIPCTGNSAYSNLQYNFDSHCGLIPMYAAQEAGQKAYADMYGEEMSVALGGGYRSIILNMPLTCQWYGVGTQGCQRGPCYAWVRQDRRRDKKINTLLHELGHTLGLQHSSSSIFQGGDKSCIMGSADDSGTCFNVEKSRQLGWSLPVADLIGTDMPLNDWVSYNVPMLSRSKFNHVTITSPDLGRMKIYISARARAIQGTADSSLNQDFDNKLTIHTSNKTSIGDYQMSYVVRILQQNEVYVVGDRTMGPKYAILAVSNSVVEGAVFVLCKFVSDALTGYNQCRFPSIGHH